MGNYTSGYRGGGQDILSDSVGCLKLVDIKCVCSRVRMVALGGTWFWLMGEESALFEVAWWMKVALRNSGEKKLPFFRVSGCVSSGS